MALDIKNELAMEDLDQVGGGYQRSGINNFDALIRPIEDKIWTGKMVERGNTESIKSKPANLK